MPKINRRKIRKILVIKNDKIGDMILSTCIFRELKRNFPRAEITVIVSKSNKTLVERNKNINRLVIVDYPPRNYKDFVRYFNISKKLKKEKFDAGIDLRGSIFNIIFFLRLANVKYKIGFYNKYFSKLFLNYAYKKDRLNKHVTFQRTDLINKALGLSSMDYWPDIATDSEDKKTADEFIRKNKLKKFVIMVPDASLEYKQWPLERFDIIIKYIKENYPKYKIVLLGSDKEKINWLKNKNSDVVIPSELLNLRITYLLFKRSELVVAHDGGPMHLAWAGRSNLIALMPKHLNIKYYGPLAKNSIVISDNIKNIGTEEVERHIHEFLR